MLVLHAASRLQIWVSSGPVFCWQRATTTAAREPELPASVVRICDAHQHSRRRAHSAAVQAEAAWLFGGQRAEGVVRTAVLAAMAAAPGAEMCAMAPTLKPIHPTCRHS